MRMRLIAEFHLASNSLSGAINGRIILKLMQKCSHLTSRNHFNGTEYFPLVKILLTDLMSCSSKNQLHSALCAGLPFLVLISPMLWCTQKICVFCLTMALYPKKQHFTKQTCNSTIHFTCV